MLRPRRVTEAREEKTARGQLMADWNNPRLLIGIAVRTLITREDIDDRHQFFLKNNGRISPYLKRCSEGGEPVHRTRVQDEINALFPSSSHLCLYVSNEQPGKPSHYATIERDPDTKLWNVVSERLMQVKETTRPRSGVLFQYPGRKIMADTVVFYEPEIVRVATGGTEMIRSVQVMETDIEVRRWLTHAAMAAQLAGTAIADVNDRTQVRVTVRDEGSRAVMHGQSENDAGHVWDGFAVPWVWAHEKVHPYPGGVSRQNCIIRCDAVFKESGLRADEPKPFCILPSLKEPVAYIADDAVKDYADAYQAGKERQIVRALLTAGVFPYVGIIRGSAAEKPVVHVHMLHFEPGVKGKTFLAYPFDPITKNSAFKARIPYFIAPAPGKSNWRASDDAAMMLIGCVCHDPAYKAGAKTQTDAVRLRTLNIETVFQAMGYNSGTKTILDFAADAKLILSEEEIEVITSRYPQWFKEGKKP